MPAYTDRYWVSPDGLRLHARDYGGDDDPRPPLLCLPGLTRNARDYGPLVERVGDRWRVIAVNFRGRGGSAAAPDPRSYVPTTYVADVETLLAEMGIERIAVVGTSLGGIVAMLLAQAAPGRVTGVLLNDVGPAIEAGGMARIRGYVGRASNLPTWMHAARCLSENNREVYPDWEIGDWLQMAKRLYRLNSAGRVVLDYDLRIAEPLRNPAEGGPDLWAALASLHDLPVLVVRGARSDVLSAATANRMVASLGQAELATVANVGHAPVLDEPVLAEPIERWLAKVREPATA